MTDIREMLDQQLRQGDLDVVDIVPIPMHGDRMVRMRTLEEALDDFNAAENGESVSYLIQVKAKRPLKNTLPATTKGLVAPVAQATPAPRDHAAGPAFAALPAHAPAPPHRPSATTASPATGENIYLPNGKLNVPYLARNGEKLVAAGEYTLAKNIFKAILASGERSGLALFGVGRCAEAEGHLDEARASYEESIAFHPTLESYQRLSSVLLTQQKNQLAAEVLERALNLRELAQATRFELHKACGNCWTRANKGDPASRHYQSALEIDPTADEIRGNLGALYLQSQRIPEAKRNFQDALASNPRNDKAIAGLASCFLAEGEKRQAHDHYAQALEIELNNPAAIYHLVKCAYEIRSYATAARVVEDYLKIALPNANLMYSLAGLQFHLGRANDARATACQILALHAEHTGAKELLNLIDRFPQA
jgi:tetratricopeptide (TPR) repeat protein